MFGLFSLEINKWKLCMEKEIKTPDSIECVSVYWMCCCYPLSNYQFFCWFQHFFLNERKQTWVPEPCSDIVFELEKNRHEKKETKQQKHKIFVRNQQEYHSKRKLAAYLLRRSCCCRCRCFIFMFVICTETALPSSVFFFIAQWEITLDEHIDTSLSVIPAAIHHGSHTHTFQLLFYIANSQPHLYSLFLCIFISFLFSLRFENICFGCKIQLRIR